MKMKIIRIRIRIINAWMAIVTAAFMTPSNADATAVSYESPTVAGIGTEFLSAPNDGPGAVSQAVAGSASFEIKTGHPFEISFPDFPGVNGQVYGGDPRVLKNLLGTLLIKSEKLTRSQKFLSIPSVVTDLAPPPRRAGAIHIPDKILAATPPISGIASHVYYPRIRGVTDDALSTTANKPGRQTLFGKFIYWIVNLYSSSGTYEKIGTFLAVTISLSAIMKMLEKKT